MKTYLAYIRVSTVKQGEHGSSLQEQKTAIETYSLKNGLHVSGWFEEMETAAKLGREMFNRMVVELERGSAAGVIIHKIDRSARNLKDWAHLGELIDRGIEVHFAHESLDLASRGGRLSADIQAVVAADYIRNLRQEVRKGFYGRLKQGLYPLPAPRGYDNRGKAMPKTINPIEGALVKETFEKYSTGAYSLQTLRTEMFNRGLKSRKGKPIPLNAFSRMLHNPFYMGIIRIERTNETFQGVHEPLIRVATFERVQAVMAGRVFARPQRHDPLLRRMLKCQKCGYGIIAEKQKGHVYYRCHSRTCLGTSVRETALIEDLEGVLEKLKLPEKDLRDLRDLVKTERANIASDTSAKRDELKKRLRMCEGRLEKLIDAYLDNNLEKELFETKKSALLKEQRRIQDDLNVKEISSVNEIILKKLELINSSKNLMKSSCMQEIRETLKEVTSNLQLMGKELVITLQFPYADVIKKHLSQIGEPYEGTPRTFYEYTPLFEKEGRTVWVRSTSR